MMRALTPWRPSRQLSTLHNEIDDLFSRFFGSEEGWWGWPETRFAMPVIDSFYRGDALVVRADLPGIDPKKVELSVEGDRLTIKGEREAVHEDKAEHYREVSYGRFERSIALPAGTDPDSVKATYKDGVLEVTLKVPKGTAPKKVSITVH
jgi:HSP20 family protein